MTDNNNSKLRRIGVFYDGNYFLHVSNYYNYVHERRSRISISGLHHFIRQKVAATYGSSTDFNHCQIVDAHYFRGRLIASEASQRGNQMYFDRVFDDILMHEGITTHYLPVRPSNNGYKFDKDIDVWLSLEAFEQAFYKRFDVVVIIASDGDYVQLCRKLHTLGSSVMLLSWDFEFTDDYGKTRVTKTSQDLIGAATHALAMHHVINDRAETALIDKLFVSREQAPRPDTQHSAPTQPPREGMLTGEILSVKTGYGFIKYPPNNLFFHYQNVNGRDFNDLAIGDLVQFEITQNEDGEDVAINVEVVEESY